MGVTSFPQCCNLTDLTPSLSPHSVFTPSQAACFDGNPSRCYQVVTGINMSSLDDLNNNEALLRTVMHRIKGSRPDECTEPGAVVQRYSSMSQNYKKRKEPEDQEESTSVNTRSIVTRINRKRPAASTKNNENNNFITLTADQILLPSWREENVFNRLEVLSLPKPLPDGYVEEKEPTYWISKKPPPIPKAGYTKSVASARVKELAKPMYNNKGEFLGSRHCHPDDDPPRKYRQHKDPNNVNWERLATPKPRYAEVVNPFQPVKKSALKFEATKRLNQLAVPKKKIDCGEYYLWLWNRKPDDIEKLHEIKQLSIDKTDMEDARILLRCDLDYTEGKIIERKIKNILPTIQYAFKKKARAVIIISHCGQPNGKTVKDLSLEPLMCLLTEALPDNHVVFLDNCIGAEAKALCEDPEAGHVFLLENLRFHPEELGYTINSNGERVNCTKESMEKFHKILMSFGDVYVNDAFTILHEETTITNYGDPKKERCYGLHIKEALNTYNYFIVKHEKKRMVAVIGGTYEQVADIVRSLMGKASEILLGGEIAMMFLHAVKGKDIGEHECSPFHEKKIKDMMTRARDTHTIINLPADVVLENVNDPGIFYTGHTKDNIDDYYRAVDIGPLTRKCYQTIMLSADLLIWHGPMGQLQDGTCEISKTFGAASQEYEIETYLLDDETISYFKTFSPEAKANHLTERSEVTMALLHRKVPKSISSLSSWRRKVKKRPPKEVYVSTKPTSYENPCMKMCNAMDRLSIDQLELKDKKVLIRCDFNMTLQNGQLKDTFRIRMAVPSICYALQSGAHAVILLSSIGMKCGKRDDSLSLKAASSNLAKLLNISEKSVVFVPEPTLAKVQAHLKNCYPGTVFVVENVNFREEETLFRANIQNLTLKDTQRVASFCEELSSMGDVYINDTFESLHIPSASTCGIMLKERACGFLLKNELRYLSAIFNAPPRPILFIIGGQYSKDKIDALKSLFREIDEVIITGRMALAFLKVMHKMPTGASVVLKELEDQVPSIVEMAASHKVRIHYPVDFLVADEISQTAQTKQLSASVGVPAGWQAVDIGDNSCSLFKQVIKRSKLIFWHGVAGAIEIPNFRKGTQTIMDIVTKITTDPEFGVVSILGGSTVLYFFHIGDRQFQGVCHMTTGGMACAAVIIQRCLPPVGMLSAGKYRQNLNKLSFKDIEITGMSVVLRADLFAPRSEDGSKLTDLASVKALLPTITALQKRGARCITVVGGYGNPGGKKVEELSLVPFKMELEKRLRQEITFFENGVYGSSISGGSDGKVFMLENLLFHPEEQGWTENEAGEKTMLEYSVIDDYRKRLNTLGELFVNESMSSLCRCDSSVVGTTMKIKCAGPVLKNELTKFNKFLDKMKTPLLVIIGSHKGTTDLVPKMDMLYDMLDEVTDVALGGDFAYTYIMVVTPQVKLNGTAINEDLVKLWPRIIKKAKINGVTFHIPVDFAINDKIEASPNEISDAPSQSHAPPPPAETEDDEAVEPKNLVPRVRTVKEGMGGDFKAMDIGPATVELYTEVINASGSIVVMGPLGEFDEKDYDEGSKAILDIIKEASSGENETPAIPAIAFGRDTYTMLETLDKADAVSHCSLAGRSCANLLRNMLLPGLEHLDVAKPKPLKKLSVDRFNISGKRVLLRLDLEVPIVNGVVLDVTKIQVAVPSVRYLLDKGAKCVVLMGHRGHPRGYKNHYLTLEPLAAEFAKLLDTTIHFLPYPCSAKVREILEDPQPGSVFLMENLKFYPAEEGKDIKKKTSPVKRQQSQNDETLGENEGGEGQEATEVKEEGEATRTGESVAALNAAEGEEPKEGEEGSEDRAGTSEDGTEDAGGVEDDEDLNEINDEYISFTDEEDLDRYMYEKMAPKSLGRYIQELSACGDIFVNDNVQDMNVANLTSMTSLSVAKKMAGVLVADVLSKTESDDCYTYKSVASLSPAPKEGDIDDLPLSITQTHSIIREAYTSSCLAVPDDLGNLDITVSYDGSWHKRGHTSRHGLGCVIDAVTGLVVDYEAMTQYCQSCATTGKRTKEEGQHTFDEWWASHEPECEANHQGSSGMMEVAAAKILWQRSLQYKFRYITIIGDGDCKTHNELMALKPYGVENPVKKEECISHFSKRLGTALKKVISVAKSDHVTLGGVRRGSLTQNKMALMQKFFTTSILKNPGNLEGMKQAIWAIFHHAASTDLSPQHQYCPTCASSWCPHQKAVAQNLPPPPHTSSIAINDKVAEYIRPTFERLTSNELLQRCLQGKTQNPNESVHSVIWTFIPKGRFVGATRIRLGLYLGAGQFNCGSQSLRDVMKEAGLTVTASTRALGLARDQERISQAERSASAESKRRREIRRRANDRLQAEIERSEGEPAYAPGGF